MRWDFSSDIKRENDVSSLPNVINLRESRLQGQLKMIDPENCSFRKRLYLTGNDHFFVGSKSSRVFLISYP